VSSTLRLGLVALCAVLIFASIGFPLIQAASQRLALLRAERRWSARSFTHYRMELQHSVGCTERLEIDDEKVIATNGGCQMPYSVSDLFALIERNAGKCAPAGCLCDGQVIVRASYDHLLGYPTRISIYVDEGPYIHRYPGHVTRALMGRECQRHPYPGGTTTVALEPLP
jgi:hypothetical protein